LLNDELFTEFMHNDLKITVYVFFPTKEEAIALEFLEGMRQI